MPDTSFITDMTFVFVCELDERIEDQIGTDYSDGTVRSCCDHATFILQFT